jgi:hypothetical protein
MMTPVVVELALAEAQLGQARRGAARIDDFLAELGERGGPVTRGSLHEARVRIALMAGDMPSAELHLARMERWFRPTNNPALVTRCQRLRRELDAESDERVASSSATPDVGLTASELVRRALGACKNTQQRFRCALEMLLDHTGATGGAIFGYEDGELVLQATLGDIEPSTETRAILRDQIETNGDGQAVTVSTGGSASDRRSDLEAVASRDAARIHALVLAAPDGRSRRVVAGAVITKGSEALRTPPAPMLDALADALDEPASAEASRAGA